jgi:hypothetical protein
MVVREASTPEITRPSAGIFDGKITVLVILEKAAQKGGIFRVETKPSVRNSEYEPKVKVSIMSPLEVTIKHVHNLHRTLVTRKGRRRKHS